MSLSGIFWNNHKNRVWSLLVVNLLAAFLIVVFTQVAHSAQVTLQWDPCNDPDVVGYRVYYSKFYGEHESSVEAGNETSYTLTDLQGGDTYFFSVTAYDGFGNESDYSEEIFQFVPLDIG